MPKGKPRTDVTVEKCVELYDKYQNQNEVARILQCSPFTDLLLDVMAHGKYAGNDYEGLRGE